MRGASVADIHLGFRQYHDTTDGRNTREVDVETAWNRTVDAILAEHEAEPISVLTIAGDVFHHPRVSDYAKKAFLDGIRRLLAAGITVIVLQGNHDAGRTAEVLTPIMLAEGLGERLYIVTEPERIRLCIHPRGRSTWLHPEECEAHASVACFPFVARTTGDTYRLDPDPKADVNILVMHAAVRGDEGADKLPRFYGGDGALDVAREAERWDVIAVGDYHEFTRLHPNALAFYSGSVERTSSNIWKEEAPKGWVLWDTEAQTMEFREIPSRPMVSLVAEGDPSADGVNWLLRRISDMPMLAGAIVRLLVDDFPQEERDSIDWALVREIKSAACHFHFDVRYARAELVDMGDRRDRTAQGGMSIAAEAKTFFADVPEEVRVLAFRYLDIEAAVEDESGEEVAAA